MSMIFKHAKQHLRRFKRDSSAVILIEFAYALPIFLSLGLTGTELANMATTNMRVSQIAMTAADNISRAKQSVGLTVPQLREVDINDNLLGAQIQGGDNLEILNGGRIIVSSLQRNAAGRQWIAWQRCKGTLRVNSRYGAEGTVQPTTGTSGFQGMGAGTNRVQAEPNSAIIFAEVTYNYRPLVGEWLFGPRQMRTEAAFYVRDDRDLVGGPSGNGVHNPSPQATRSACNVFNDTF